VGNGAAITPVVVFSVTTGLMVDTIAANACASAYKKDAALYVGNMLVMVLRVMECLKILGGLSIPRDGVVVGAVPRDGCFVRAIAWEATAASWDGTVCRVGGGCVDAVAVLVLAVLVGLVLEERRQRRRRRQ